MWCGSMHVEEPYITIGQFTTTFYFSYFLFFVPLIGIIENTLFDLSSDNSAQSPTQSSTPCVNTGYSRF